MVLSKAIPLPISKKETMMPSELKKYERDEMNGSDSTNEDVRIIGVKAVIPMRNEYPGHIEVYLIAMAAHEIPIEKKNDAVTTNFMMFRSSIQMNSERLYVVHNKLVDIVEWSIENF